MKLSVIVPVYNGEKYLEECLHSLSLQELGKDDYEIIVINDGSTDKTEEIIDSFCKMHNYAHKMNKNSGGVSSARNLGLTIARGDYIAFVDSDDAIAQGIYKPLLDICYEKNLDAIYYDWTHDKENMVSDASNSIIADICIELKRRATFTVWVALFKRELIVKENLKFNPKMVVAEDTEFSIRFAEKSNKVGYMPLLLYFYRVTEGSLMHSETTDNKILSDIRAATIVKQFIANNTDIDINPRFYNFNDMFISQKLQLFLLRQMVNGSKAKDTFNLLASYDLNLKLNNCKMASNSVKERIKHTIFFLFRYKFIYCIFSKMYRIYNKIKKKR